MCPPQKSSVHCVVAVRMRLIGSRRREKRLQGVSKKKQSRVAANETIETIWKKKKKKIAKDINKMKENQKKILNVMFKKTKKYN